MQDDLARFQTIFNAVQELAVRNPDVGYAQPAISIAIKLSLVSGVLHAMAW
jgi:hypothetical protein